MGRATAALLPASPVLLLLVLCQQQGWSCAQQRPQCPDTVLGGWEALWAGRSRSVSGVRGSERSPGTAGPCSPWRWQEGELNFTRQTRRSLSVGTKPRAAIRAVPISIPWVGERADVAAAPRLQRYLLCLSVVLLPGCPRASGKPLLCISDKRPGPAPGGEVPGAPLHLTSGCRGARPG